MNVNMHGNHVASCLCCKNLDMDYETDYNINDSPGAGYSCNCLKGHFTSLAPKNNHQLIILAPDCVDFIPRIEKG